MRRVTDEIFIANATRELADATLHINTAIKYAKEIETLSALGIHTPSSPQEHLNHLARIHNSIRDSIEKCHQSIKIKSHAKHTNKTSWQMMLGPYKKKYTEIVEKLKAMCKTTSTAQKALLYSRDYLTALEECKQNVLKESLLRNYLEDDIQNKLHDSSLFKGLEILAVEIDVLRDEITESLAHRLILQEENEEDSDSASDYQEENEEDSDSASDYQEENEEDSDSASDYQEENEEDSDSASDYEESKHQIPALYTTFNPQDFPVYMAKCATREAAKIALSASWEARRRYDRIGFPGISRAQQTAFAPGTPIASTPRKPN